MKRYEDFNRMMPGEDETAERQATGMTLEKLAELEGVEVDTEDYMKWYDIYLNWLNEEVGA